MSDDDDEDGEEEEDEDEEDEEEEEEEEEEEGEGEEEGGVKPVQNGVLGAANDNEGEQQQLCCGSLFCGSEARVQ